MPCWAGLLCVPVGGGPPARRPRRELRSARRLEARPGLAAAHGHRSQAPPRSPSKLSGSSGALHTSGTGSRTCACTSARSPARPRRRPSMSHVIPLRLVQTLNLHRWNCNVFGVSRKMTALNYVRNLGGGGVVAARGYRSLALPMPAGTAARPSGALHASGAWCAVMDGPVFASHAV